MADKSCGWLKLCKSPNLPGLDFGLKARGLHLKKLEGAAGKGLAIQPLAISELTCYMAALKFSLTVLLLLQRLLHCSP